MATTEQDVDLSGDRGDELESVKPAEPEKEIDEPNPMDEGKEPEKEVESEPEPEKKDDEPRIPKAEFDRRIARERERTAAAEARAAELERQASATNHGVDLDKMEKDIAALEAQHAKLLLDGETEKAAALAGEIRRAERQIAILESSRMSVRAKELAKEEIRFEAAIERLELEYPALNPDREEYSQELVDEVLLLKDGFEAKGMPASQALAKAVGYVMRGIEAPKAEEPAKKGMSAGKDKTDSRKAVQVNKNIEAAAKQPAKTLGVGQDSDKRGGDDEENASVMTQEEFAALPESTRAKLRGDFVGA